MAELINPIAKVESTTQTKEVLISQFPEQDHPNRKVPLFRSTKFQAWVLAAVFFCGPGMYSAINGLGAGGLRSPTLVNITSGIGFGINAVVALFGGVFINLLGVKATLSIGVLSFGINSAALYCNNLYGTIWFLYFVAVLGGFCASILWVVQGAIMLAYPEPDFQGRFISIWYASIFVGQGVGGAISLGFNAEGRNAGAITPVTYIPIIAISCAGPFIALLLSSPRKVVRRDGVPVQTLKQPGPITEAKRIFAAAKRKEIILLIPLFVYSQWFLSYEATFVAVYHSVRGRALGSFLSAVSGVIGTFSAGIFLDKFPGTRAKTFRWAFYIIYTINSLAWIWATVVQWYYQKTEPVGLDWTQSEFYASFLLFLFWNFSDKAFQTFMYALIGTLSSEVDELARYVGLMKAINTAGAALGYGVQVEWSMMGSEAILVVLWFVQIIPSYFVVRDIQDLPSVESVSEE